MSETLYILSSTGELYHYGVKGQKWGVRRYQNEDGTLTEAGKKRQAKLVKSDKEATISKGHKFYRISDSSNSDTSSDKIYVTSSKEASDFYINALGGSKIYKTGKAYVHEYVNNTDLKLPDKKTMEKIELGLLKDKAVQKELVDSLMKKGLSREQATKQVAPYSAGKAFMEKVETTTVGALLGGIYGGAAGLYVTMHPIGAAAGAGAGALAGAGGMALMPSEERSRALNVARVSYGDKNNKTINRTLERELSKRGYNAMKDYNDRRAYNDNGKEAIVVFNSKNNLKNTKVSEVNAKEYGKAYARNYLKQHPESKLDFGDLVKDGEAKYKNLYETGVVARAREKENKRILEEDRKKG